ncbi:MAG: hypothetical protein AAFY98_12155 [Verrucomicrobiota bacterium]
MNLRFFITSYVVVAFTGAFSLSGQDLLTSHTDIFFSYDETTGEWSGGLRHGGTSDNPTLETPFGQASLPLRDQLINAGDRLVATSFDSFTGAVSGEPFWELPQVNQGYTWPGFRNAVTPNLFRSYQLNDSRQTATQRWVTYSLQDVIYSGQSTQTPHFAAYQFDSFGALKLWMSTVDDIDQSDVYYLDENGHAHLNFSFNALGIFRVGFRASGILDSDGSTVTSQTEYVTFAVGTLATWLADHYGGADLTNSLISGMDADAEGDGVNIRSEYAFNLNPTIKDRHYLERDTGTSGLPIGWLAESSGATRLHLQMVCRKPETNPQIEYCVEFNDDLSDPAGWVTAAATTTTSIDDTWERVTVIDSESISSKANRFARVRVLVQETITY